MWILPGPSQLVFSASLSSPRPPYLSNPPPPNSLCPSVLPACTWVWSHPLEHGKPTMDQTTEENGLFLWEWLSVGHSFWIRNGSLCPLSSLSAGTLSGLTLCRPSAYCTVMHQSSCVRWHHFYPLWLLQFLLLFHTAAWALSWGWGRGWQDIPIGLSAWRVQLGLDVGFPNNWSRGCLWLLPAHRTLFLLSGCLV